MTFQDPAPLTSSASDPKTLSGGAASPETLKVVANDGSQHYYPQRQVYTQPAPSSSSSSPPIQKRDSALATSDTATVASDTDDAAISASSKAQFRAPVNPRLPTGYVHPMPTLLKPGVGVGEVRCHYDRQRSGLLHCTNGYSYALIAPEAYAGVSSDQKASSSSSSSPAPSGPGSAAAMGVGPVGSGDPYHYALTASGVPPPGPRSKFCGEGIKGTDWWDDGRSKYAGSEERWSKSGVASTGTEAHAACATCGSGPRAAYGQGQGQAQAESSGEKKPKQVKRAVSAPGGHGPEAVSVPIHIPLYWDGTNVVSPPGYRSQFDVGVDYPLDPDTEVVPVPINIAALVTPDGTMALLPVN
ncbi:hypothetical protein BGZ67_005016 [Mortierella alpina]|nr:hypothetical protein BGZ67_005016 [Mortierella alpina]